MRSEQGHVAALENEKPFVWVIEDDLPQQEALSARLEMGGCRVQAFRSHRLAADHVGGDEIPNVILCDYETEYSYSADWFIEQLKQVGWLDRTKVIAISGSEMLNDSMLELGAHRKIVNTDMKQMLFGDAMAVGANKLVDCIYSAIGRSR